MKNTAAALSMWSKDTIGDIFSRTKELEQKLLICEERCLNFNTSKERKTLNKKNAEMIRHLKLEDSFWRQKTGLRWAAEGDFNTKLFHSSVNMRRRKLLLNRIQKGDGSWATREEEIATEATEFYQNLFKKADQNINQALFNNIPTD